MRPPSSVQPPVNSVHHRHNSYLQVIADLTNALRTHLGTLDCPRPGPNDPAAEPEFRDVVRAPGIWCYWEHDCVMDAEAMDCLTRPLTSETWNDFAQLVEANSGAWGGCCASAPSGSTPQGMHCRAQPVAQAATPGEPPRSGPFAVADSADLGGSNIVTCLGRRTVARNPHLPGQSL
jgi:hypothetical protein